MEEGRDETQRRWNVGHERQAAPRPDCDVAGSVGAFDMRNISTTLDVYERCVAEADQVSNAQSLRLLGTAKVVGITTTGAAKYHALLRALAPTIVVCDEAGEVLEVHLLLCLTSATQHVIQIGDHKQLRPILNEHVPTHVAKRGYDLDVSLFERLSTSERTERRAMPRFLAHW
ncbi:hypothetical protein H310_11115 [Aphanomyces invadans]|uniref:DNA2/NAM7 helicase helicase domain-containing protein n=1 Tax=Aphanomyces invadans TaxID=157072 RepID=A0A024TNW4_9STRA|nr:hypothetical protein H310_11115 [Aphanomyces invadans]ETV95699.1 hypothetical protein H310_11115 [Aphanomyces invadans]|eukprot:XP_008875892.1 hypothetical protein H310_11115 [Aphanomyces invadans]